MYCCAALHASHCEKAGSQASKRKYHYPYQDRAKLPCDKAKRGLQDYTHTESPNSKEFNFDWPSSSSCYTPYCPDGNQIWMRGNRGLGPCQALLGSWTDDHDDTFVPD
ncbi:unnamed protein product [Fusarium venenatum]|uniref:Uncharacterized protein n=1 Tax=Fusarium venenatum TaxID=56646 RepID=A0A2L2SVZ0_9HYPO|nr:uncharacterized protein FVRRES_05224 [Fusarium venenatum]CEI60788.1 unnamed protein product [Fusarium venenatum]